MSLILFQRFSSIGGAMDTITSYYLDTTNDHTVIQTTPLMGANTDLQPPVGTLIYSTCVFGDLIQYKTKKVINDNNADALYYLTKTTTVDSPSCCTISAASFNAVRTNNTSAVSPNGSIVITAPTLTIADYEASINGGASWVAPVGSSISFTGLSGFTYNILIREVAGVCSTSISVIISDVLTYPPLITTESEFYLPALFSPVFFPITIGYTLDNAIGTVRHDGNGTYIEVPTVDGREYLATLPIIRIIGSIYAGKYQILSVDNPDTPLKFYISATYVSDQNVSFVPFDRQVFQLFAEKTFNVFVKIADITIYANSDGVYLLRLEGFLQAVFKIDQPVNNGDEITLLRKYYVTPRDFDMVNAPTVFNAVYSAIPDLTNYLGDLIPLGPAPINFITEQVNKGLPVLFSYIDVANGRVKNITSGDQNNIVTSTTTVNIEGLPLNIYDVRWVNPAGGISDLSVTPALPSWITLDTSDPYSVHLIIDTGAGSQVENGDYDGADYDGNDYLTGGPNVIVGCYEYTFKDGEDVLFVLSICIYPLQSSRGLCPGGFNIAWINQEGGWSSYIFDGVKTYGKELGDVTTFKSGNQLRRLSVDNSYNTAEVNISVKGIRDLNFIASLRQSIQAFLYSDSTLQWSIPIVLDRQSSFNIYSTPFKQIEVKDSFKFRYAEEITIQSQ
jgi:hypothetical protein